MYSSLTGTNEKGVCQIFFRETCNTRSLHGNGAETCHGRTKWTDWTNISANVSNEIIGLPEHSDYLSLVITYGPGTKRQTESKLAVAEKRRKRANQKPWPTRSWTFGGWPLVVGDKNDKSKLLSHTHSMFLTDLCELARISRPVNWLRDKCRTLYRDNVPTHSALSVNERSFTEYGNTVSECLSYSIRIVFYDFPNQRRQRQDKVSGRADARGFLTMLCIINNSDGIFKTEGILNKFWI